MRAGNPPVLAACAATCGDIGACTSGERRRLASAPSSADDTSECRRRRGTSRMVRCRVDSSRFSVLSVELTRTGSSCRSPFVDSWDTGTPRKNTIPQPPRLRLRASIRCNSHLAYISNTIDRSISKVFRQIRCKSLALVPSHACWCAGRTWAASGTEHTAGHSRDVWDPDRSGSAGRPREQLWACATQSLSPLRHHSCPHRATLRFRKSWRRCDLMGNEVIGHEAQSHPRYRCAIPNVTTCRRTKTLVSCSFCTILSRPFMQLGPMTRAICCIHCLRFRIFFQGAS